MAEAVNTEPGTSGKGSGVANSSACAIAQIALSSTASARTCCLQPSSTTKFRRCYPETGWLRVYFSIHSSYTQNRSTASCTVSYRARAWRNYGSQLGELSKRAAMLLRRLTACCRTRTLINVRASKRAALALRRKRPYPGKFEWRDQSYVGTVN